MTIDWTDPDSTPLWDKRAPTEELEEAEPAYGQNRTPIALPLPPRPTVTRVSLQRQPEDVIRLADGRRLTLQKVLRIEAEDGSIRQQRLYHGPKQLRVISGVERTTLGELLHVMLAYPNHEPTAADIRMVKEALFGEDILVMWTVPNQCDVEGQPTRHMVNLWEMPRSWSSPTPPIAIPE